MIKNKLKMVLQNYLNNNPKFLKDFKNWVLREKRTPIYPSCGSPYIPKYRCNEGKLNEFKTIVFYEWSKSDSTKRYFTSLKEFYVFLEECKIPLPAWTVTNNMEKWKNFHSVCVEGRTELLAEETKEKLEESLNKTIKK